MFLTGTITIQLRVKGLPKLHEEANVSAMVSEKGIAYHEMAEGNGWWCITRVPSGRQIVGFLPRKEAQRVASEIETVVDWINTPLEELSKADILKERIRQVVRP